MQSLKGPPFPEKIAQNNLVGSRSGINLSINGTRKPAAMLSSRALLKDLLQYLAIAAIFNAFGHSSRKDEGGNKCGKNPGNPEKVFSEFGLGTPPPLELSLIHI